MFCCCIEQSLAKAAWRKLKAIKADNAQNAFVRRPENRMNLTSFVYKLCGRHAETHVYSIFCWYLVFANIVFGSWVSWLSYLNVRHKYADIFIIIITIFSVIIINYNVFDVVDKISIIKLKAIYNNEWQNAKWISKIFKIGKN